MPYTAMGCQDNIRPWPSAGAEHRQNLLKSPVQKGTARCAKHNQHKAYGALDWLLVTEQL